MEVQLKCATYNLFGLNQGLTTLKELCNSRNVICVQEHWLSSDNLSRLQFSNEYIVYSSSAMNSILSQGILRGRPFGGVATFIHVDIAQWSKLIVKSDRLIVCKLYNTLIYNLYLPCASTPHRFEICADILSVIHSTYDDHQPSSIIICGDFNCCLDSRDPCSALIRELCVTLSLERTDQLLPVGNSCWYTYHNSDFSATSLIDYFLVSHNLLHRTSDVHIIANGANLSDHCPVFCSIAIDNVVDSNGVADDNVGVTSNISKKLQYRLRWDKANLSLYESVTFQLFENLYSANAHLRCNVVATAKDIEVLYNSVVNSYVLAADTCIPKVSANYYKFWWDESLENAKRQSIDTHGAWRNLGKPKSGPIFQSMYSAKLAYKQLIKIKEAESHLAFTSELGFSLEAKNSTQFWKSWKSKFPSKNTKNSQVIDGKINQSDIANIFAQELSKICQPNTASKDAEFKETFWRNFSTYPSNNTCRFLTTSNVFNAIHKLQRGKAAGYDGITAEHLLFGHSSTVDVLTVLFNACISNGYVPDGFGKGLLFPLLKSNELDSTSSSNYRGITVSCIISKLFEICIFDLVQEFLYSSEHQYGFKAGVGCRNAILTARVATEYLTSNGSTAVLCTLDISKAFDKVNIYCLLNKLMERGIHITFIQMFTCWFTKCYVSVKWGDYLSSPFRVMSGVRQGGVLSPFFFAIYIDSLIIALKKSGFGLYINNVFFGVVVYADDILLLSSSMHHMQKMLHICTTIISNLDLCFNVTKSTVTRIGVRYDKPCSSLLVDGKILQFVSETKYLGTYILSGRSWRNNFSHCRSSFYRAFNAILSKCSGANSDIIRVHLLTTVCVPILAYALEACYPSKTDLSQINDVIDNAVRKIFDVNDKLVISQIRQFLNIKHVAQSYWSAKCKFLRGIMFGASSTYLCVSRLTYKEFYPQLVENGVDLRLEYQDQLNILMKCYTASS